MFPVVIGVAWFSGAVLWSYAYLFLRKSIRSKGNVYSVYEHLMKASRTIDRNPVPGGDTHIMESEIQLFVALYQKYDCKPTIICDDIISRFTLDVALANFCNQAFLRLLLYYNYQYMPNIGP